MSHIHSDKRNHQRNATTNKWELPKPLSPEPSAVPTCSSRVAVTKLMHHYRQAGQEQADPE